MMNEKRVKLLVKIALISALMIGVNGTVFANSINDRLTDVERVVQAHGQLLQDLQHQLNDVQQDLDTLRGQLQVTEYQLNQAVERQKKIYQQIDELTPKSTSKKMTNQDVTEKSPGVDKSQVETTSTLTGVDSQDYSTLVDLVLKQKNYTEALSGFEQFVKKYPKSTYLPNAYYWLGQLNFSQNHKDTASYYFAIVVRDFAYSAKASESMYKIGLILQEKGQHDKASAIFQQVIKNYPSSPEAAQAKNLLATMDKSTTEKTAGQLTH